MAKFYQKKETQIFNWIYIDPILPLKFIKFYIGNRPSFTFIGQILPMERDPILQLDIDPILPCIEIYQILQLHIAKILQLEIDPILELGIC